MWESASNTGTVLPEGKTWAMTPETIVTRKGHGAGRDRTLQPGDCYMAAVQLYKYTYIERSIYLFFLLRDYEFQKVLRKNKRLGGLKELLHQTVRVG